MRFTDQFEHVLDAKLRIAIPAVYRAPWDELKGGQVWCCVPWPSGHLRLYTEADFDQLAAELPRSLFPDKKTAERRAAFFSFVKKLTTDRQGRITLDQRHLDLAGLKSTELLVVGAGDHLQIHERSAWRDGERERFKALEDMDGL